MHREQIISMSLRSHSLTVSHHTLLVLYIVNYLRVVWIIIYIFQACRGALRTAEGRIPGKGECMAAGRRKPLTRKHLVFAVLKPWLGGLKHAEGVTR